MTASTPEVWVIDNDSSASEAEQCNNPLTQQQGNSRGEEHADVHLAIGEIRNEAGQIVNQNEEQVPDGGEAEEEGDEDDDDEEEEDEDLEPLDEIKECLCLCLDNAKSAGLFAHHDILKDAPNPGAIH
jgi:hypothetical protein